MVVLVLLVWAQAQLLQSTTLYKYMVHGAEGTILCTTKDIIRVHVVQYKYMHVQRTLATSKCIQLQLRVMYMWGLGPPRLPILDTSLIVSCFCQKRLLCLFGIMDHHKNISMRVVIRDSWLWMVKTKLILVGTELYTGQHIPADACNDIGIHAVNCPSAYLVWKVKAIVLMELSIA